MSRTELVIQLLKVAIGLAFGGYFVWWSLQVLDRLTPEYDGTAMVDRIFKSNPSAELRMPAMHQWPETAEEEAIKTDNDSWRFKGETTIGLQPARAVSATPTGSDGASALEPMTSVDDDGECFGACVLVERQAYAALLLQKSIGASTHALKRRRQKSRSLLSSDGNAEKLFQEAKQPPELAEIQGISDKEIRFSLSVSLSGSFSHRLLTATFGAGSQERRLLAEIFSRSLPDDRPALPNADNQTSFESMMVQIG